MIRLIQGVLTGYSLEVLKEAWVFTVNLNNYAKYACVLILTCILFREWRINLNTYISDELNNGNVLYATKGMYSQDCMDEIVMSSCAKHNIPFEDISVSLYDSVMQDYLALDYDMLMKDIYAYEQVRPLPRGIIIFGAILTTNGVSEYCVKFFDTNNKLSQIITSFGCKEYAIYCNNFDICFIGYRDDAKTVELRGKFRVLKDKYKYRSKEVLAVKFMESSKFLLFKSYTDSLKSYFEKIFGLLTATDVKLRKSFIRRLEAENRNT